MKDIYKSSLLKLFYKNIMSSGDINLTNLFPNSLFESLTCPYFKKPDKSSVTPSVPLHLQILQLLLCYQSHLNSQLSKQPLCRANKEALLRSSVLVFFFSRDQKDRSQAVQNISMFLQLDEADELKQQLVDYGFVKIMFQDKERKLQIVVCCVG